MNISGSKRYINSICRIIEHKTKAELTKHGYKLILNYLDEFEGINFSERARYVIKKYISIDIPSLSEIREKHKKTKIDELDRLVLKMEYEAEKLGSRQ